MIKGYCISGNIEAGLGMFKKMEQQGLFPDAIIYNTIMDGCVTRGQFTLCDEMFELMQRKKVAPSCFTLTILVKRYGRTGNIAKAFELVDRLPKEYNFKLEPAPVTCLLQACLSNKRFDKAVEVFEKMKKVGPAPDSKAYERMIQGCIRYDKFQAACRYVEESYGLHGPIGYAGGQRAVSGVATPGGQVRRVGELDRAVLCDLVKALGKRNLGDSMAVPMLQKLRSCGIKLPQSILSQALCSVFDNEKEVPRQREQAQAKRAPWLRDSRRARH